MNSGAAGEKWEAAFGSSCPNGGVWFTGTSATSVADEQSNPTWSTGSVTNTVMPVTTGQSSRLDGPGSCGVAGDL